MSRRRFERELRRLGRKESKLAVVLGQIEGWSELSGHWGHAPGEEALRRAYAAVETRVPVDTVLARVGWIEYAALLPEGHDPVEVGRALRKAVEEVDTGVELPNRLTVSIGVYEPLFSSRVDLDEAQRALGAAIVLGGNRVVVYRNGEYVDVTITGGI